MAFKLMYYKKPNYTAKLLMEKKKKNSPRSIPPTQKIPLPSGSHFQVLSYFFWYLPLDFKALILIYYCS